MEILNINNTKVVYHYLPSKLTNIQILTDVGSASEEKSEWGYAHILEHNFFRGSKKYPGPLDISRTASDLGGKLNAWTWIDATCYHITVLNEYFSKGFDILADMYQNPLFPENEFKRELNPILSEMRQYEDDPGSYLANRANIMMLGEQAGHPTIGVEDSVKSATVEKVLNFRNKFYGGQNTMISIVGGISKEDVIDVVSKLFSSVKISQGTKNTTKAEFKGGELVLDKEGISEAVYTLTFPSLDRFHPDIYKQKLMTYVLGGNSSGMLHETIREILGLSCYGIYSSQINFDCYDLIEISCGIDPKQVDRCHTEVLNQINKLMTERVDDARLSRAKASLRTSIALHTENSGGYNDFISLAVLKGATENPVERLLKQIELITVDDIIDMAQKTFSAKPFKAILMPQ